MIDRHWWWFFIGILGGLLIFGSFAHAGTGRVKYTEPADVDLESCRVTLRTPVTKAVLLRSEEFGSRNVPDPIEVEFPIDETVLVLNELQEVEVVMTCKDVAGLVSDESNALTFVAPPNAPAPPAVLECAFVLRVNGVEVAIPCEVRQ
jgi:hypothetical protein